MTDPTRREHWGRLLRTSLIIGVAGAAACVAGLLLNPTQFFHSYHMAYLFWWELGMGCLALGLLYQLVGGQWGYTTRPFFDAGIRTLPLLALLFVPIALGMEHIFVWAQDDYWVGKTHTAHKQLWLDPSFFLIRAAVYFVLWLLFGWLITRNSPRPDGWPATATENNMGKLPGAALAITALAATGAGYDWGMSLEPDFHSTIFGGIFAIGSVLCGLALVVAMIAYHVAADPPIETKSAADVLNDLGNLLLAFLMIWTYFEFSQFLIIWSGNIPDEAQFYAHRRVEGWGELGVVVAATHFCVPFLLLLSRDIKRNPRKLAAVAVWLLFIHLVGMFWTIMPFFYHHGIALSWIDVAAIVGIGGLWVAMYAWQIQGRGRPPLPEDEHAHA